MLKRVALGLGAVFFWLLPARVCAQVVCPLNGTLNPKLVCMIPQVFGPVGLGGGGPQAPLLENSHMAGFESDFATSTLAPLNEAVGVEVSQLPLASPSSGISFVYDPSLKTFSPSTDESLGPILGERAGTIGRKKLFLAFSYQYFGFNTIDGKDLNNMPIVFEHQAFPATSLSGPYDPAASPCPSTAGMKPQYFNMGVANPCFVRDYINTRVSINLNVHQFIAYATYGITRNFELSLAVPILQVNMGVGVNATIVPNSIAPSSVSNTTPPVWHLFNPAVVNGCANLSANQPCLKGSFSDSGSASGIGDVIVRGKYTLYNGERAGVAAGVEVRTPTGDEQNYLGSGTTGVAPFVIFSYRAKVAPHFKVGYQWNGDSILAGDFAGQQATGAKAKLPNSFLYVAGADATLIPRRMSASFDIYGQHLFNSLQLISASYTDQGACSDVNCTTVTPGTTHPDVTQTTTDVDVASASLGLKVRPAHNFIITGNVLIELNNSRLRSRAVPLVGLSYTF
jgi:hypothetical protein